LSLGLDPFTPHDLRHTAASLTVRAGADVKVVQRMLGHASAAMTLDVYAGLFAEALDQVATRLKPPPQRRELAEAPAPHGARMEAQSMLDAREVRLNADRLPSSTSFAPHHPF
jgi:hypothetical protein